MHSQAALLDNLKTASLFTRMALKGISAEQWNVTPPALGTNINWQFGHILVAHYHFGVQLIVGDRPGLFDAERLEKCYGRGTRADENWGMRPDKDELLAYAHALENALSDLASGLTDAELNQPVQTFIPVITSKHAALLFCGSHQMYHNGQLGLLRKALAQI
jgi:uncharacterized damage-inducible protein DinB